MINPKYSPYYGEKIFSHSVIINENTSSDSQVSLAYSLDEIEQVSVSGTDLKIKVGITGGTLEGRSYAHLKVKLNSYSKMFIDTPIMVDNLITNIIFKPVMVFN